MVTKKPCEIRSKLLKLVSKSIYFKSIFCSWTLKLFTFIGLSSRYCKFYWKKKKIYLLNMEQHDFFFFFFLLSTLKTNNFWAPCIFSNVSLGETISFLYGKIQLASNSNGYKKLFFKKSEPLRQALATLYETCTLHTCKTCMYRN